MLHSHFFDYITNNFSHKPIDRWEHVNYTKHAKSKQNVRISQFIHEQYRVIEEKGNHNTIYIAFSIPWSFLFPNTFIFFFFFECLIVNANKNTVNNELQGQFSQNYMGICIKTSPNIIKPYMTSCENWNPASLPPLFTWRNLWTFPLFPPSLYHGFIRNVSNS